MSRWLLVVLMGAAWGIAAGVFSLAVELALLTARFQAALPKDGEGGLSSISAPLYAPLVAVVGFIAGALWQLSRSGRR